MRNLPWLGSLDGFFRLLGSFVEHIEQLGIGQLGKLGCCQILQGLMVGLLSSLGLGTCKTWMSDSLQGLKVDWFVQRLGLGSLAILDVRFFRVLGLGC